jgi:hypothetical protein
MNSVTATWKNGQVVLDTDADWPEGRRLVVREERAEIEFMTEDQQSDDLAAIQRWIDELRALPHMPPHQRVEDAESVAWRERSKAFNVDAVRNQMQKGIS